MEFDHRQLHFIWNYYVSSSSDQRSRLLTNFLQGFYLATYRDDLSINELNLSSDVQSMKNLLVRDLLSDIHLCCVRAGHSEDTSLVRHYLQRGRGWLLLYTLLQLSHAAPTATQEVQKGHSTTTHRSHGGPSTGSKRGEDVRDLASVVASLLRLLRGESGEYPVEDLVGTTCLCLSPDPVDTCFEALRQSWTYKAPEGKHTNLDFHHQQHPTTYYHHPDAVGGTMTTGSSSTTDMGGFFKRHRRVRSLQFCPPPKSDDSDSEVDGETLPPKVHLPTTSPSHTHPGRYIARSQRRRHHSARIPSRHLPPTTNVPPSTNRVQQATIIYDVTLLSEDDMENMFAEFEAASESADHHSNSSTDPGKVIGSLGLWDVMTLLVSLLGDLCRHQLELSGDVMPTILDMMKKRQPKDALEWVFLRHCLAALCRIVQDLVVNNSQDVGSTVITGHRIFYQLFEEVRYLKIFCKELESTSEGELENASSSAEGKDSSALLDMISEIVRASLYIMALHFQHLLANLYFPSTMMKPLSLWIDDGGPTLVEWLCRLPGFSQTASLALLDQVGMVLSSLKAVRRTHSHRERCTRRIHRKCNTGNLFCHHSDSLLLSVARDNQPPPPKRKSDITSIVDGSTGPVYSTKVCAVVYLVRHLIRIFDSCDPVTEEPLMVRVVDILEASGTCCCMPTASCAEVILRKVITANSLSAGHRKTVFRLINAILLRELTGGQDLHLQCSRCLTIRAEDEVTRRSRRLLNMFHSVFLEGDDRLSGIALKHLLVLIKMADTWLKEEILCEVVLPVLRYIQIEVASSAEDEARLDRLVSFGKAFLCLLTYLPCPLDLESRLHQSTLELLTRLTRVGDFRRYVYRVLETFILTSPAPLQQSQTGTVSTNRRRRRLSVFPASTSSVNKLTDHLLGIVDFPHCIASAATSESSARLLHELPADTDIWNTYETLFLHSAAFRLRFVDANGSDTAYLLLKELIVYLGESTCSQLLAREVERGELLKGKPAIVLLGDGGGSGAFQAGMQASWTPPLFKLFECLLVLVMEGSRVRKDFFYSGYSCEVIYNQLETLLVTHFPKDLDLARMTLESMVNTCICRGSYVTGDPHVTDHIEKILHALSTKFENLSEEEGGRTTDTVGDSVPVDLWGYHGDVDSESESEESESAHKESEASSSSVLRDPLNDLLPQTSLLRLTSRVTLSIPPSLYHSLQEHVLTRLLPAISMSVTAPRVRQPEKSMLPTMMEKHSEILRTTENELSGLRRSVLNITRIVAVNRLSVEHVWTLLQICKDNPVCLADLLDVLTDVARSLHLSPHTYLEYPVLFRGPLFPSATPSRVSRSQTSPPTPAPYSPDSAVHPAAMEVTLPSLDGRNALWPSVTQDGVVMRGRGLTAVFWMLADSRQVLVAGKDACPFAGHENKKKKSKDKLGQKPSLVSRFRTSSISNNNFQETSSEGRTGSPKQKTKQEYPLLPADQVANNFNHIFSLDVGMVTAGQQSVFRHVQVRLQMWCEPASGSVYFRLYQAQSVSSSAHHHQKSPSSGHQQSDTSSIPGVKCLVPVADAGLRALLPLRRWSHVAVVMTTVAKNITKIQIIVNGTNQQDLALFHPPIVEDRASRLSLSLGHKCLAHDCPPAKILQLGNFSLLREPIKGQEDALLLYCLGPDWLLHPKMSSSTINSIVNQPAMEHRFIRLLTMTNRDRDISQLLSVWDLLRDRGESRLEVLVSYLLAAFSPQKSERILSFSTATPDYLLARPASTVHLCQDSVLKTSIGSDGVGQHQFTSSGSFAPIGQTSNQSASNTSEMLGSVSQPPQSSSFLSDLVKRVAGGPSSNHNSSQNSPQLANMMGESRSRQWVSSQSTVDLVERGGQGLTTLGPAVVKETLDVSLEPLGGVRVLLYLFAKIVGEDDIGDLQSKSLNLLLSSIRNSSYLRQDFVQINGVHLIGQVVRNPKFKFTSHNLSLLINATSSCPLVEVCHSQQLHILTCANRMALCTDVLLARDLLLTWPVWNRLSSQQGCILLDALLMFVAEENHWLGVNAAKFQEVKLVEAALFACQELLQEEGNLPSEGFCTRLVNLIEACVGAPPELNQLITICSSLLLLHPPANTFVTFESNNFYHRVKTFVPESSLRTFKRSNSTFYSKEPTTDEIGQDTLSLILEPSTTIDSNQLADNNPFPTSSPTSTELSTGATTVNKDLHSNQADQYNSLVMVTDRESPLDLSGTLTSKAEARVLRRFYDLTTEEAEEGPVPSGEGGVVAGNQMTLSSSEDSGLPSSGTDTVDFPPRSPSTSSSTDTVEDAVQEDLPDNSAEGRHKLTASRVQCRTLSEIEMCGEDPGAIALTSGLLRLLTDILRAKLPDSMVGHVVGHTLSPHLLVTLAMHPSARVREKVLETFFAYLTLAHRYSEQLTQLVQMDAWFLLANQIHQFSSSPRLVEIAFEILIGQEHLVTIDTPGRIKLSQSMPAFEQSGKPSFFDLPEDSEMSDAAIMNGWGKDVGYSKSIPLVLALLEKTGDDLELCSKTLGWLNWFIESSYSAFLASLDCGMIECFINLLTRINSQHRAHCPAQDAQFHALFSPLETLVVSLVKRLFFSSDQRHYLLFADFNRLLQGIVAAERINEGASTSCIMQGNRQLIAVSMQTVLDGISSYAERPQQDLLNAEISMRSRRSLTPVTERSLLAHSYSSSQELSPARTSILSAVLPSRNYLRSSFSATSEVKEVTTKEIATRFKKTIPTIIDFLINLPYVAGPLAREKHWNHLFEASVFEFFLRAVLECSTSVRKKRWSTFLWGMKDVLRVQLMRIVVHSTLPGVELSLRRHIVQCLAAETNVKTLIKFVFSSLAQAANQMADNLENLCIEASCAHSASQLQDTVLAAGQLLDILHDQNLVRNRNDLVVGAVGGLEETTGWLREEKTLSREKWDQVISTTVYNWQQRHLNSSQALQTQAVQVTQQVMRTQNVERKRFIGSIKRNHAETVLVRRRWGQLVHHLTHERAVWHDPKSYPQSWHLDPTEGPSRIRKRLSRCHLDLAPRFFLPAQWHKLDNGRQSHPLGYLFSEHLMSVGAADTVSHLQVSDKISVASRCSWIRLSSPHPGEFLVGETAMYFVGDHFRTLHSGNSKTASDFEKTYHTRNQETAPYCFFHQKLTACSFDQDNLPTVVHLTFGTSVNALHVCFGADEDCTFTYMFDEVREIHKRRYELRDVALEIFLTNGKTCLLAMESTKNRENVLSSLDRLSLPNRVGGRSVQDIQSRWLSGYMTNFDYLTHLNAASGRSYNDLMQYPVFPFILKDYTSSTLDIGLADNYRQLGKAIAVQNSDREGNVRARFLEKVSNYRESSRLTSDDMFSVVPPFHYSSHYSNTATVLYYLTRVSPFTEKFVNFQDSNFDVPDRMFHTVSSSFQLSTTSASCVKEIIPEFFYLPEFFDNNEGFNFGDRQTGETVNHVNLPPWSQNDARLFTLVHRAALECCHVSENLSGWIDLIFGYKQMGKPAVDSLNLFHPYTYFGAINPDDIQDAVRRRAVEDMIKNYGQTPKQLFLRRSHPSRRCHASVTSSQTHRAAGVDGGTLILTAGSSRSGSGISRQGITGKSLNTAVNVVETVCGITWGHWVGSPEEPEVSLVWKQKFPASTVEYLSPLYDTPTTTGISLYVTPDSTGSGGGNNTSSSSSSSNNATSTTTPLGNSAGTTTTAAPALPPSSIDPAVVGCDNLSRVLRISHPTLPEVSIPLKIGLHPTESTLIGCLETQQLSANHSWTASGMAGLLAYQPPCLVAPLMPLDPRVQVTAIAVSSVGKKIYLGLDKGLILVYSFHIVWRKGEFPVVLEEEQSLLSGHRSQISALSLCQAYSLLASGDVDGNVLLWDTNKLQYVRQLGPGQLSVSTRRCPEELEIGAVPTAEVVTMTFSETLGDLAVARRCKQGRRCLLSVYTVNARLISSQPITGQIHSMTYSCLAEGQNVNVLVLGLNGGRVQFFDSWQIKNINRLQIEQDTESPIISLTFSPGARRLYASSLDGWVYLLESREGPAPIKTSPAYNRHFTAWTAW